VPWVPAPDKLPYRCFVSGQDAEDDGPYYSPSGRYYAEAGVGDDRELVMYLSPQAIREACEEPGSPFVLKTTEEDREASEAMAQAELRIEKLEADLADAEAELATQRERPIVDVEVLAESLGVRLGDTFARKTGPKKAA